MSKEEQKPQQQQGVSMIDHDPTTICSEDIPLTRRCLKGVATKFNIYFLCIMALLSGCLFIAGMLKVTTIGKNALANAPDWAIMVAVGFGGFALFFPWFTCLYFSRHLLLSVQKLESSIKSQSTDSTSKVVTTE